MTGVRAKAEEANARGKLGRRGGAWLDELSAGGRGKV